jgi:hypothetical protein
LAESSEEASCNYSTAAKQVLFSAASALKVYKASIPKVDQDKGLLIAIILKALHLDISDIISLKDLL